MIGRLLRRRDPTPPEPSVRTAGLIEIVRRGTTQRTIFIDGVQFPWFLAQDGIVKEFTTGEMPAVTFTLIADEIRIVDALDDHA